jgi:hypothetical protein
MATIDDIARIALGLPETTEGVRDGTRVWRVKDKAFVWERPLRKADWAALEIEPNDRPTFCVMVAEIDDRLALMDAAPNAFFVTPHFANYPAVLGWLDNVPPDLLEEVITDAWIRCAPKRLAKEFLAE